MNRTPTGRILASLRLVGVTVVLAAGIAGFASTDSGATTVPVQLAVVSTAN